MRREKPETSPRPRPRQGQEARLQPGRGVTGPTRGHRLSSGAENSVCGAARGAAQTAHRCYSSGHNSLLKRKLGRSSKA